MSDDRRRGPGWAGTTLPPRAPGANADAKTCAVCDTLDESEIRELDQLLSDPGKWPASLWDAIGRPARMTPAARRFGQLGVAEAWLTEHGHEINRRRLMTHVRNHVINVPDLAEMFAVGAPEGALLLMDFWAKALDAGSKALAKLIAQLEADETGERFTTIQLLAIAEFSSRLAAVASRGRSPFDMEAPAPPPRLPAPPSSDTGFMGIRPSVIVGGHRLRQVGGEARVVADHGPQDRAHYNETADQAGTPRL